MKDFVNNLTDEGVKELMYALSRSGKVVIPQYYRPEHIQNFTQNQVTKELMIGVQKNFECDYDLNEILHERVILFVQDEIED
jgi:hypothetical protein